MRFRLYRKLKPPMLGTWFFLENPRFIIVLRHVLGYQDDGVYHNHRRPLLTFILKGGYTERRLGEPGLRTVCRYNWLPSTAFHRIEDINHPTWTIGIMGRPLPPGEWGFIDERDGVFRTAEEHFRRKREAATT